MVFGWGKKKQEEKSIDTVPQDKTIHLSDVQKIITDLNELRQTKTLSEIKRLRDDTEPLIIDLIKIGNALENDNLKTDDVDKHLAIIVIRGKRQVIDVIKKDVTSLPKISSIDDAKKLNSSLNQILKKTGDVLGRQTRVIHIFAKKYAAQLKENLEIMNTNHSEIRKLLQMFDNGKSASDDIIDILNQIKTLQENKIEISQKIVTVTDDIDSLQEKILSIQNSIDTIHSSDNYKKYLDLKNTFDTFSVQKSKIKNQINTQFTKISRPLSRYEYTSSLDKDQKNILSDLVDDPFNVLLPKNKDSIIVILENVRKGVSSGSISVKDVDKTLSQITETEEILDRFVKQISEYFEQYHALRNNLDSLRSKDLLSLENDLEKNVSFKNDCQLKSKTLQDEIHDIDLHIPKLISQIEEKLRQFSSTRYVITSSQN